MSKNSGRCRDRDARLDGHERGLSKEPPVVRGAPIVTMSVGVKASRDLNRSVDYVVGASLESLKGEVAAWLRSSVAVIQSRGSLISERKKG